MEDASSLFEKERKKKRDRKSENLLKDYSFGNVNLFSPYVCGAAFLSLLPPLIWAARSINRGRHISTQQTTRRARMAGAKTPIFPSPVSRREERKGAGIYRIQRIQNTHTAYTHTHTHTERQEPSSRSFVCRPSGVKQRVCRASSRSLSPQILTGSQADRRVRFSLFVSAKVNRQPSPVTLTTVSSPNPLSTFISSLLYIVHLVTHHYSSSLHSFVMPASLFHESDPGSASQAGLEDQRALQLALELSMLGLSNDSDPLSFDPESRGKKSQNTTECVPVPSSEHVAEIVGRQGMSLVSLPPFLLSRILSFLFSPSMTVLHLPPFPSEELPAIAFVCVSMSHMFLM